MRTHYLFPLLSGLLLTGLTACGDDSSESGTDDTADSGTDDATDEADDTDDTDDTADDTDDTADDTDDTADDTDDTADDTDDTADDTDDTADDTADGGDGGTGGDDDGVDGGDGGTGGDDDGVDGGDGGTGGDDDGVDGGDGGDDVIEAGPEPLPEGACAESPAYDVDGGVGEGAYGDCDRTLNGGTCELTCADNYVGGFATCTDGVWTEPTCVRLGSLTAQIGNAQSGANLADAIVYIEGFFDPSVTEGDGGVDLATACSDSPYCGVTDGAGSVSFADFPSGDQKVVIVKDGFDEIALPIAIAPGEEASVHLDALPTGFLDGNIVILLSWESGTDLDLALSTPTDPAQCVDFTHEGDLTAEPWAQSDRDVKGNSARGPETIRIVLNEAGDGPAIDGTYSVIVAANASKTLDVAQPSVRLIRAGEVGAQVDYFKLPEDAVEGATGWHVLDLHGDGTLTAGGETEALADLLESEMPCIAGMYE